MFMSKQEQTMPSRNPIARYAHKANKAKVFVDKKKEAARRACRQKKDDNE